MTNCSTKVNRVQGFESINTARSYEEIDAESSIDLPDCLPDAPSGWIADKPEGSTADVGGFQITNVHRDYRKNDAADSPTTAISILDSVANPDYVQATTAAWNQNSETSEGYSKSVTIDGNPGFEAYEKEVKTLANGEKKELKHASLWVMIAERYFVEIELQNQDPKELQDWVKRLDLKKLAAIK